MCCVGMWNVGHGAVDGRLQKLPVMMEVQCVVLEGGISVIGRLRRFLFDVCVKCAVGVSEAVGGKWKMSATTGVRSGCVVMKWRVIAGAQCMVWIVHDVGSKGSIVDVEDGFDGILVLICECVTGMPTCG